MVKEKRSYPKIEEHLEQHDIVLFMKGSKEAPQCGFSAKVVTILEDIVDGFHSVDVLLDSQLREDLNNYILIYNSIKNTIRKVKININNSCFNKCKK